MLGYSFYRRLELSEFVVESSKSANIGRRAVVCGAAAVAFGLLTNDGALASVNALGVTQVGSKLQISLAKNKVLNKVGGAVTINLSDGSQVAVVRTGAGTSAFKALNLTCTHQSATVAQSGNNWVCPQHGGTFSLTGSPISGPVNRALYSYPVKATKTTVTIG